MHTRSWITFAIAAACAVGLLAACAGGEPEKPQAAAEAQAKPLETSPAPRTPAEEAAQAGQQLAQEQQRLADLEKNKDATKGELEQARLQVAEAQREAEAAQARAAEAAKPKVPPEFGSVGKPPPPPTPVKPPAGVSFDKAFPPLPAEPTVRIAVLSDDDQKDKGDKVALILGSYQKDTLEKSLGMAVTVAYISYLKDNPTRRSAIHYRPNFLKAAVSVASVLPDDQELAPMTEKELAQVGVDLIVYIGHDYR